MFIVIRVHPNPPARIHSLQVQGYCPHCKTGTTFTKTSNPDEGILVQKGITTIVVNYSCDICRGAIPIQWLVHQCDKSNNTITFHAPKEILSVREPFDFEYVPDSVKKEIEEALDCLSVSAYNGFAALCRRAIQEICTDLGAKATIKIKKQIEQAIELAELDEELGEIMEQLMLSGHDGSHPHLPEMNTERASVALELLRDLTHELYRRRGKIKKATELRQKSVKGENKKS